MGKKKRRRRWGRLFLRGEVYYCRIRRGAEEYVKALGPDQDLAEEKLREIELDYLRGKFFPDEKRAAPVTLKAFLPRLLKALASDHRPETLRQETFRLKVAAGWFRGPMHEATPAMVAKFMRHLAQKRKASPATRNRYRAALSGAWKIAIEDGYATENPALGVKPAREEKRRPPRLSEEQIAAIVARARPELRPLFRFLPETGLRRSEALALTWRDVDLGAGTLTVARSKSGRYREVPLSPEAAAILGGLRPTVVQMRGAAPVFAGIAAIDATRGFRKAADAAGLEDATLHHLRGTFITRGLERGASLGAMRDLAGHSSAQVTDRYVSRASEDDLRVAVGVRAGVQRGGRRRKSLQGS